MGGGLFGVVGGGGKSVSGNSIYGAQEKKGWVESGTQNVAVLAAKP